MEVKKIVFVVVAIATVGGIGYYLYNSKKKSNDVTPSFKKPTVKDIKSATDRMVKKGIAQGKGKIEEYKAKTGAVNTAYPKNLYE